MPSPTYDSVLTAMKTIFTGVGTLQTVASRSPEIPVPDPTPALYLIPAAAPFEFGGVSARANNYRGHVRALYIDRGPEQQTAVAGSKVTLATIETALLANMEAIIGAFKPDHTLSGAVVFAGPIPAERGSTFGGGHPIQVEGNAGGPIKDVLGGDWVVLSLLIPFVGRTETY